MKKILFFIHNMEDGGAQKVLTNLVNNMDRKKFDIAVVSLFGGGINEQFLNANIHYKAVFPRPFPGNSKVLKLFSPGLLHQFCIKEHYDIEVSYLEGVSARIISGCSNKETKLVSWIHVEQHTMRRLSGSFANEQEAAKCYDRFDQTVCVSKYVHDDFCSILNFKRPCTVLYNTVESVRILDASRAPATELSEDGKLRLVAVGSLKESKGYMRMLRVIEKLYRQNYPIHLYILGIGPDQQTLEQYIRENGLNQVVTLLGYHTNPYRIVAKCDLFLCASFAEGFSTAATEALIVGTPVCTVEVSGMKEMLGDHNEYGIVTENDEDALYVGVRQLLDSPEMLSHYQKKAAERGRNFSTEETVRAVEDMLLDL